MAIQTYTDLQNAVLDWLARTGDADLVTRIPDFIALCEQRIAYGAESPINTKPLRIAAMETAYNPVTTPGSDSVPLPSGYLAMRSRAFVAGNPNQPLTYLTPESMVASALDDYQGKPLSFTILGQNIRLAPTPDTAYTLHFWHYAQFPALATAVGGENWLLTNAPSVYLYGTLLEAAPYMQDDTAAQRYGALFASAINGLQNQNERARHSGMALTMRTDTGNP